VLRRREAVDQSATGDARRGPGCASGCAPRCTAMAAAPRTGSPRTGAQATSKVAATRSSASLADMPRWSA
jgi:hypothetical protein